MLVSSGKVEVFSKYFSRMKKANILLKLIVKRLAATCSSEAQSKNKFGF